jgi:hypothetical protein
MTKVELDHRRYIDEQRYRRTVLARLRRLMVEEPLGRSLMNVVHSGGCCQREPWLVTYAAILEQLSSDGERVAGVVL